MAKQRISKQHSIKNNKYTSVPKSSPAQHTEVPGQGYSPMHGGDVLSLNNVPQPGHPMTQLFANDETGNNQYYARRDPKALF